MHVSVCVFYCFIRFFVTNFPVCAIPRTRFERTHFMIVAVACLDERIASWETVAATASKGYTIVCTRYPTTCTSTHTESCYLIDCPTSSHTFTKPNIHKNWSILSSAWAKSSSFWRRLSDSQQKMVRTRPTRASERVSLFGFNVAQLPTKHRLSIGATTPELKLSSGTIDCW